MRGLLNLLSSHPATVLWLTGQAGVVILLLEQPQEESAPKEITELYGSVITRATQKTLARDDECGKYETKSEELDEIRRDKEHQKENENIRTALEDTGCSSG